MLIDFGLSLRLPPETGWKPESIDNGIWVRRRDLFGLGRMLEDEIVPSSSELRRQAGFVKLVSALLEEDPRRRPKSPAEVRKALKQLVAESRLYTQP